MEDLKVFVGIPYREAPGRAKWLRAVKKHYRTHFPDWTVETVDAGGEQFNRSASRNAVVARAREVGADVVIVNDADVLAHSGVISEAVDAAKDGQLHYPFQGCRVLSGDEADRFVANVVFPEQEAFPSTGGIYVCTPDAWGKFGGADEGFQGWGGEDDAVCFAADRLVGVQRHRGTAISLGHSAHRLDNPNLAANYWRARCYELAQTPEAMRSVIARRGRLGEDAAAWDRIAVVCPSRGRPENLRRLRDAVAETALTHVTILAGLDDDDHSTYPPLDGVECVREPGRHRLNWWWNKLAGNNLDRFDTFVFLGDDNVPRTPGWDFLLDDELRKHHDRGFATGPDGLRNDKRFTWAAISAEQIRRVGYVGPKELTHLYIDNAWQSLARATGTMWWMDHVLIDHMHYTRSGAGVANDQTYRQANSSDINAHDKKAWRDWEASPAFQDAVEAVNSMDDYVRPAAKVPIPTQSVVPDRCVVTAPFQISMLGQEVGAGQVEIPLTLVTDPDGAVHVTSGDLRGALLEALGGAA